MKNKTLVFSVALILICGTAFALARLRAHQKLGKPGIKATPVAGQIAMKIDLPENVARFVSSNVPEPAIVLGYLPKDTSYAERLYTAPDGFQVEATIVLMGVDRTSIHNADYCLGGQGFTGKEKSIAQIQVPAPQNYQLPVSRWNVSGMFQQPDGRKVEVHGIYIFWFVTDGAQTPSHFQMMWQLATHVVMTGELQRWAYVSYFAICAPGHENAAFERMKQLIGASVPEFQLPLH